MHSIKDYNYHLPQHCIAQAPASRRDASKLLVVDRRKDVLLDRKFTDILELVVPGDLLVVNDTKVFPARLIGSKPTGGRVELFILEYPVRHRQRIGDNGADKVTVTGLVKSSKRPKPESRILFDDNVEGRFLENLPDGKALVELSFEGDLDEVLEKIGRVPLPPYIERKNFSTDSDRQRYQTVFADRQGAVAAPTAGLHFTEELLGKLTEKKVAVVNITLHVGYGTFSPVRVEDIRDHRIHSEYIEVTPEAAKAINRTKKAGNRVWAVGTTTARSLEFAADDQGVVHAFAGACDLYIYPGYSFKVVENLITNFHLPQSSLLFLVSALAGRQRILAAYNHAVENGYRFYSYGDAMVIITR